MYSFIYLFIYLLIYLFIYLLNYLLCPQLAFKAKSYGHSNKVHVCMYDTIGNNINMHDSTC